MKLIKAWLLVGFAIMALGLVACDSDSGGGGGEGSDPAPTVVSVSPHADKTGVAVDEDIKVGFSAAMDPTSVAGQITLSSGTVGTLSWNTTSDTLTIAHTDFAEGVQVDVTLGTGIKSAAGVAMAAPYAWSFFTRSSTTVSLITSIPADGDTGVSTNTSFRALFSQEMDLVSLDAHTNFVEGTRARKLPFFWTAGEGEWAILNFTSAFTPGTPVTITISQGALSKQQIALAADVVVTFTTGSTADTTPPTLLSISPANGSTISTSTSEIVMTFSEAVVDSSISPSSISMDLMMAIGFGSQDVGFWNAEGTILTVPFTNALKAGTTLEAHFTSYADLAGNVQTTPVDWSVTVAGTADFWPFIDGMNLTYFEQWSDTAPGPKSRGVGAAWVYERWEEQPNGDFHLLDYDTDGSFTDLRGWDVFDRFSSRIDFKGFTEYDFNDTTVVEFSTPVTYAKLPFAVQTWSGQTTMTLSEGVATVDYSVAVVGQEDLPFSFPVFLRKADDPGLYWANTWKTALNYSLSAGGEIFGTGTDSIWFAPGVGIVRYEEDGTDDQGTYMSERTFFPQEFLNEF